VLANVLYGTGDMDKLGSGLVEQYALARTRDRLEQGEPTMTRTEQQAAELSYQLGDLPDRQAYLTATVSCLHATVAGDVVSRNNVDVATGSAELRIDPPEVNTSSEILAAVMDEHPLVRRFLAHPHDVMPQRISDYVPDREFRSSRVYSELLVPMDPGISSRSS
jgi:hypothetical protein